jgi:phosphomannomutase
LGDLASIVKAYDVVPGGLGSADMLYGAGGDLDVPGAMITASRNPSRYHGIKLCRASAKPIGIESGPQEIKDLAERTTVPAPAPCTATPRDLLRGYADQPRKLNAEAATAATMVAVRDEVPGAVRGTTDLSE